MNALCLQWIIGGCFVMIVIYATAIGLTSVLRRLFGPKISLSLGVIVIGVIYTAVTWHCFYNSHIPLTRVIPLMELLLIIGASLPLLMILFHRDSGFTYPEWIQFTQASGVFLSIFIFLTILYSMVIVSPQLPIVTRGNDIWSYSKYANLVLSQPLSNNVLNYDLFKEIPAYQTPTAFVFLAGLSFVLHMPVTDILTLALLIVMATSAYAVKSLGINYLGLKPSISYFIALLWVTAPFTFYISSGYFLAQCMEISLFLITLLVILTREVSFLPQTIMLTGLNYLMFMTYPIFYFPYMGLLLFAKIVDVLYYKIQGQKIFNSGVMSALLAIPLSLILAFLLDASHVKKTFELMLLLPHAFVAWAFDLLNPVMLTLLPSIPKQIFYLTMSISLFLIALRLSLSNRIPRYPRIGLHIILTYLFFMTAPIYFVVYCFIFLLIKAIDLLFFKKKYGVEKFNPYAMDIFLIIPLTLVLAYLLQPNHLMNMLYKLLLFEQLPPQVMVRGADNNLHAGDIGSKIIGYVFLFVWIGLLIKNMQKNSLSKKTGMTLCILFMMTVMLYLGYYLFKGASYQQWKFAGSIVLPFSFVPLALTSHFVQAKQWVGLRGQQGCLLGLLLMNILMMPTEIDEATNLYRPYIPFRSLVSLDTDTETQAIVVNIKTKPRDPSHKTVKGRSVSSLIEAWIILQFINQKPLITNFFSRDIDYTFPPEGVALITNQCNRFKKYQTPLGDKFCIIRKPNESK